MFSSLNPTTWSDWAIVAGVVLTPLGVFHKKIRMWFRKSRAEAKFMDGMPGVEGVMEAVPAAPLRLAALEKDVKAIKKDLASLVDAVTGEDGLKAQIKKLFPNGGQSNEPGDLLARAAKKNGTWMEHPVTEKEK